MSDKSDDKKPALNAAAAAAAAYEEAVEKFGAALSQLHAGQYAEAKAAFEAVGASLTDEPALEERTRTYASICQAKMDPAPAAPNTPDECYNVAVVLANRGEYDEALGLLNRALQEKIQAKFLYARASTYALKGNAEAAIGDLRQAISEEPNIRFQAVNDSDFEPIREEPAFIDIIEPTPTGA